MPREGWEPPDVFAGPSRSLLAADRSCPKSKIAELSDCHQWLNPTQGSSPAAIR